MDLASMRRDHAVTRLLDYVHARSSDLLWVDQDALNAVFEDAWHELPPRWNVQHSFWSWANLAEEIIGPTALAEAKADPAILHFEGPSYSKPWNYLCPHPFVGAYRALVAETPWGAQQLTDRTWITRLLKLLPVRYRYPAYERLLAVRERRH
jgi:lipopolysaccharide biosynthesis glycosyltransferase